MFDSIKKGIKSAYKKGKKAVANLGKRIFGGSGSSGGSSTHRSSSGSTHGGSSGTMHGGSSGSFGRSSYVSRSPRYSGPAVRSYGANTVTNQSRSGVSRSGAGVNQISRNSSAYNSSTSTSYNSRRGSRSDTTHNSNSGSFADRNPHALSTDAKKNQEEVAGNIKRFGAGVGKRYFGSQMYGLKDSLQDAYKAYMRTGLPGSREIPIAAAIDKFAYEKTVGKANKNLSLKHLDSVTDRVLKKYGSKLQESGEKDIEDLKKNSGTAGKWGIDFAAGAAELGLDMGLTLGRGTMVAMYNRAYGSAKKTAIDEGATEKQAKLYGQVIGGIEVGTEKISSVAAPLRKLYGKGATDELTDRVIDKIVSKTTSKAGKNIAYHGAKTVASAIGEGLEEMVSEGLDPVVANTIYANAVGKPHSTSAKDVLYAGSIGAALGGALGGGGQVVEYNRGKKVLSAAENNMFGEGGIKSLINEAKTADEDTGDNVKAQAYDELVNTGQGIVAGQANELYSSVQSQRARDDQRYGIAMRASDNMIKKNGYVPVVGVDNEGNAKISDNTRSTYEKYSAFNTEVIKGEMQLPEAQSKEIAAAVSEIQTGIADTSTVNMFTTANPEARTAYERITGETLPDTNQGTRAYLYEKLAENRVESARAETEYFKDTMKGLIQQDVTPTYDTAGQEAFSRGMENVNVGNGNDVSNYIVSFEHFYEAGRTGLEYSDVAKTKNPAYESVSGEIKKSAYEAGVRDRIDGADNVKGMQIKIGQTLKESRSNERNKARRGKVISELSKEGKKRVSASAQAVYRTLARTFNLEIHLVEDIAGTNANGFYKDGVMYLNINADRPLSYVFSHEITHHMQQYAPEQYAMFKQLVREKWFQQGGIEDAISQKIIQYRGNGVELTREEALDEILADSTYEIIQSQEFIDELCRENRSLAQSVLDAIRNVIDKLRVMIAEGQGFAPKYNESLLSELDILKDAAKLWTDGLMVAAQNRAAVGIGSETERFSITEAMTESERYEDLKDKKIKVAEYNPERLAKNEADLDALETRYRKDANKLLKPLASKLGIIKKGYTNPSIDLDFNYSNHNLDESTKKQTEVKGNDIFVNFAKMMSCFEDVVNNAELIEVHKDKYVGTRRENTNLKNVYVLVSAFKDQENIIPVKLEVKELEGIDNVLYVSMTLQKINEAEVMGQFMPSKTGGSNPRSAFLDISLAEFLPEINDETMTKYIPKQFFDSDIQGIKKDTAAVRVPLDESHPAMLSEESRDAYNGTSINSIFETEGNDKKFSLNENNFEKSQEAEGRQKSDFKDSEGKYISNHQADYFRDSKIRNENGDLLVLYHQTDGDFNIFDTRREGAGARDNGTPYGIFLKPTSKDIGLNGKKQMALYANITNPLKARNRAELDRVLKSDKDYAEVREELDNLDATYGKKFDEAKKAFIDFITTWRKDNPDAGRSDIYNDPEFNKVYEAEDAIVEEWTAKADELSAKCKEMINEYLNKEGYDGIVLEEDAGSFGRSTKAYIALDPQQVKNTDNLSPTTDPDIRFSFAGDNALNADNEMLKKAKEMYNDFDSSETIRKETGWHLGTDGKWRFEIDDSQMKVFTSGDALFRKEHPEYTRLQELYDKFWDGTITDAEQKEFTDLNKTWGGELARLRTRLQRGNARLADIIQHDVLFENYPQLEDVRIKLVDLDRATGAYAVDGSEIMIDEDLFRNEYQEAKRDGTLIHEIQHAIQDIEGFAMGSNFDMINAAISATEDEVRAADKYYESAADDLLDALDEAGYFNKYGEDIDITSEVELSRIRDEYRDTDPDIEELVDELEDSQKDLQESQNKLRELRNMSPAEFYKYAAGEVEARDTANRLNYGEGERRATRPDIDSPSIQVEDYVRFSIKEDSDIDYESLVSKPDMKVVEVSEEDIKSKTRKNIVDEARKNVGKYGKTDDLGRLVVQNEDTQNDIVIGAPAIRHGLTRDYETNARIALHLGEYLKNAVKVNEIEPRDKNSAGGYILLGYGQNKAGEQYPAYFVIRTLITGETELIEFDSLYSINGKKISEAIGRANQGVQSLTSDTISISELMDIVNEMHSDILPESVAEHYGNERRKTKLGESVKYSLPDESGSSYSIPDYSKKEYNRYGWAVANELLSREEMAVFQKQVGDKARGDLYKIREGLHIIPTGEKGLRNVLVYTDGNFERPSIAKIIRINLEDGTEIEAVTEDVYDEEYKNTGEPVRAYKEKGVLDSFEAGDYDYTEWRRNRRSTANRTIFEDRTGERDGRGSDRESQTDSEEIKYSLPDESNVLDYINESEGEFYDVPPMRYYEIRQKQVKLQTYDELQKLCEKLKADKKLTHGKVLDKSSVTEQMNDLVRCLMTYSESYSLRGNPRRVKSELVKFAADKASIIFRAIKNGDYTTAMNTAYLAASDIVESLDFVDDANFYEYKELRDYLRTTRMVISEEDMSSIPDFTEFKRDQFGRLRIVKENGISVDQVYGELCEMYPELFDTEITNPADQLMKIADVRESLEPYDMMLAAEETEQLKKQTAQDLMEISALGKPWKSWADKKKEDYDARLKLVKTRHQEAVREIRRKERARADERIAAEKEKAKQKIQQEKQRSSEKLQEEKQKSREKLQQERVKSQEKVQAEKDKARAKEAKRKTLRERAKSFGRIKKNYDWLCERLVKPTDDKHIPHAFTEAVADLLMCFDLQTERSKQLQEKRGYKAQTTIKADELRKRVANLRRIYAEFAPEDDLGNKEDNPEKSNINKVFEYDGYVFALIDALEAKLDKSESVDTLSDEDLAAVDILLKSVVHNINNCNKCFNENIKAGIDEIAKDVIAKADEKIRARGKVKLERGGTVGDLLNESNITSRDLFERMGGGMETMYMGLRSGFDKHINNITELREFFEDLFKGYHKKKKPGSKIQRWRNSKGLKTVRLESGEDIKISVAQIMSLYCSSKREQALGHILEGGIVLTEVKRAGKFREAIRGKRGLPGTSTKITYNDVLNIISQLTSEQRSMADKLQGFLNGRAAEWGNEASMKMYGYEKFTEKDYFPIKSSRTWLKTNAVAAKPKENIRNFGFTKNTVQGANNTIVIDDIFTVFADHVNKMSQYNALAPAISDFMRVYNYDDKSAGGVAVKGKISDAWGSRYLNYILRFMEDIQSNFDMKTEGIGRFMAKSLANYKRAAIGFNLRVAVQQPTAIARAFLLINPIYFVSKNHTPSVLKKMIRKDTEYKDMIDHCPIARWKSWGNTQVDMARDIDAIMMNEEWTRADLISMEIYGVLDNYTWSKIWGAVRAETKAKHKDVEVDSEEFYRICNERASEIFDKTQVVDSVFHRSQAMRNTDAMSKTLTSFMAEPTRTYNMMKSAYGDAVECWQNKHRVKAAGKFIGASNVFLINAAAVSAAAAVADALRGKQPGDDDDEDKEGFDLWLANAIANFWDNANPLSMIPIVKDIWSFKDGWGSSNMGLEGFAQVMESGQAILDKIGGGSDKDWNELMRDFAEGMGYVTGRPVKNILREYDVIQTKLMSAFAAEAGGEDTASKGKEWINSTLDKLSGKTGKSDENEKGGSGSDRGIVDKLVGKMDIEDGSTLDNVLNKVGLNLTDEERAAREKKKMLSDVESQISGLTGDEKNEKLWKVVTKNYTNYVNDGNIDELKRMRSTLKEFDGDVDKFDKSVLSKIQTAYKKNIGEKGDPDKLQIYRDYLKDRGYTDGKISQEIIAKSDTAKEYQKALCLNDEEAAGKYLSELSLAGLTYESYSLLFDNRSEAIKGADYSSGEFAFPVNGEITSGFGGRQSPGGIGSTDHKGIDIGVVTGTSVAAADGGKVSLAGWNGGYGNCVIIDHGNGRQTLYGHLEGYTVQAGDVVGKGQEIGKSGSTGKSTGPHLHFGVKEGGRFVDPMSYFR